MTIRAVGGGRTIVIGGPRQPLYGSKWDMADQMREAPTAGEAALWSAVNGSQIWSSGKPVRVNRQQVIRGFIADFCLPAYRAIIEVDGGIHLDVEQARRDARRDKLFHDWDYSTLRVSDDQCVCDPKMVAEVVLWFAENIADAKSGWNSRASLSWWFGDYGVLDRGDAEDHVFRVTGDLPDGFPRALGSETGGIDEHDTTDCTMAGCATRFANVRWPR